MFCAPRSRFRLTTVCVEKSEKCWSDIRKIKQITIKKGTKSAILTHFVEIYEWYELSLCYTFFVCVTIVFTSDSWSHTIIMHDKYRSFFIWFFIFFVIIFILLQASNNFKSLYTWHFVLWQVYLCDFTMLRNFKCCLLKLLQRVMKNDDFACGGVQKILFFLFFSWMARIFLNGRKHTHTEKNLIKALILNTNIYGIWGICVQKRNP